MLDNKNIGKVFSKYELLFLDYHNSNSEILKLYNSPYLELPCLKLAIRGEEKGFSWTFLKIKKNALILEKRP